MRGRSISNEVVSGSKEKPGCGMPDNKDLVRIYPNSKYFYDNSRTNRTWLEAREFCEINDLELLEITSAEERAVITKYMSI